MFSVSRLSFIKSNHPNFIANNEWTSIHRISIHWIIRLCGNAESYYKLQPKLKQFPSLQVHLSWFGLPCQRKPLTVLWKTTTI